MPAGAPRRVFLGLLIGAASGLAANLTFGGSHTAIEVANHYVTGPVGQVFLRLLLMVAVPLVFASVALGVASLGDIRRVGRVGTRALGYFLLSTAIAVVVGALVAIAVRPGDRIPAETRSELMATYGADASETAADAPMIGFGVETIVNVVPRNPVRAAADFDMLGTLFFAVTFGLALTALSEAKRRPMMEWLQGLRDVVDRIVAGVMRVAPVAVACLLFGVTSRFGFGLVGLLGWYLLAVVGGLLLHVGIVLTWVLRLSVSVPAPVFLGRARDALATAFSTSSTNAALPATLHAAERGLGVPPRIAGFVIPLGASVCMNGTALFEAATAITLAQTFAIPLSAGQVASVLGLCVLTSIGTAGVPGGAIPLLAGVLMMVGIPGEAIALVLGIDRALDMARSTVNVLGNLSAVAYVAHAEGEWSADAVPIQAPLPVGGPA